MRHDQDVETFEELLSDPKASLIEVYLKLQSQYEEIYGPDTVVVIEVGSFFEVYGVDNDEMTIGKPKEVADILNLQLTRKNKSIPHNDIKNPLLAGFPTATFDRYIARLMQEKKYTIVIVRQKGIPPKVSRFVDTILSPGINIEYCLDHDDNFLGALFVDMFHGIPSIGYAVIDVTTGKNRLFESHSTKEDPSAALDDLFRYIQAHQCAEMICVIHGSDEERQETLEYLDLANKPMVHIREKKNPIAYQNELFKRVYAITSPLSPIEFLDLEKHPLASEALSHLLDFIIEHDYRVAQELDPPTMLETDRYLYLGNDPLEQLNILSRDPHEETVLRVIDKTATTLGKRLLKERLTNPIQSKDELEKRYALAERVATCHPELTPKLRQMYDLERIMRRVRLRRLHPFELNYLHDTLTAAASLGATISSCDAHQDIAHYTSLTADIERCAQHIEETFNLAETGRVTQLTIDRSLFHRGRHHDIDELVSSLEAKEEKLAILKEAFVSLLHKSVDSLDETKEYISIKQLDKEGHYLTLTKSRFSLIEPHIKEAFVSLDGTVYALSDFRYKKQMSTVKITADIIDELSEEIVHIQKKIIAKTKDLFIQELERIDTEWYHLFHVLSASIAAIDVATSTAICAEQYAWTKPTLIDHPRAFLSCTGLRHPLVERHEEHGTYIPHDIVLGDEACMTEKEKDHVLQKQGEGVRGMLLYGINASGKSSLMKSIGVAVVLAQSGFFVPATSFRCAPFASLFTRIIARDHFERGLSSFGVEMMELKNIFNRSNEKSLVLGDEISHGTETTSAIAIVGAALKRLIEKRALFVFTTHLHQLHDLDILAETPHIASVHMSVHYDEAQDLLIFDRILKPGNGSSIYGLEFAQSIHMDETFLSYALAMRKKITGAYSDLEKMTHRERSAYHKDLYLTSCTICKGEVDDTHHIAEQHTASESGHIGHMHKNHKYNLIPICKSCHEKIHRNEISVDGFVMTDKGLTLQYQEKKSSTIPIDEVA